MSKPLNIQWFSWSKCRRSECQISFTNQTSLMVIDVLNAEASLWCSLWKIRFLFSESSKTTEYSVILYILSNLKKRGTRTCKNIPIKNIIYAFVAEDIWEQVQGAVWRIRLLFFRICQNNWIFSDFVHSFCRFTKILTRLL